jgi:TATA-box binding protein (TBP) (component of TFIID and TFIIIB)
MWIFIYLVGALVLAGCQREGPAEKAGNKIDNGIEKLTK